MHFVYPKVINWFMFSYHIFFNVLCSLLLSTDFSQSFHSCCKLKVMLILYNHTCSLMKMFCYTGPWWPAKHILTSGNIANMGNMKYFETMCLGDYSDSSIAYQFQSRQLLQFKELLKLILPVILLSFYAASSSNECVFLSLNIAFQRNHVQIMKVKFPIRRVTMVCTYNNVLFTQSILQSCLSIWVIFLILLAGGVELNPGPGSTDSISISGDLSDFSIIDVSIFARNFSIVHYNIQSLVGKLDLIQTELSHLNIIALSETWLSNNVSTERFYSQIINGLLGKTVLIILMVA